MLHQGFKRVCSISILVFVLTLLLVSTLPAPQASFIKDVGISDTHPSIIVAGRFFDVHIATTSAASKITIIMYRGGSIPDEYNRSIYNYYRWEYDHGKWKDNSGHKKSYMDERKCKHRGNLYSFHVCIDPKARTGKWKIKISIDNKGSKSYSINVRSFLPVLGITSVRDRRPFINLFKRSQSFKQKNVKKLLSALRKEEVIQALYVSKDKTDEVTIPILLDSSSSLDSLDRIEKNLIKKARKLFPNSRVVIIPLRNLPIDESYNLIYTHKLLYAKDEDTVKEFEHDIVASYLDRVPLLADELKGFKIPFNVIEKTKADEDSDEINVSSVNEKPKIVEMNNYHSTKKGVIPPPKIFGGDFLKALNVSRILSFFVVLLLIFPAFYPTLLAGPPPPGINLGESTNSTVSNLEIVNDVENVQRENKSKQLHEESILDENKTLNTPENVINDGSNNTILTDNNIESNTLQESSSGNFNSSNIDAKNTSSLENQQDITDNPSEDKQDTIQNNTESETKDQSGRENPTFYGVDLTHDGRNNSIGSINESSNEVNDTNATSDNSINESTFNITCSNNSASNSTQIITNQTINQNYSKIPYKVNNTNTSENNTFSNNSIVSMNQSINQTCNESNYEDNISINTSSGNFIFSNDSILLTNQSINHNDSFIVENISVPLNCTSNNNGTNSPSHNKSENVSLFIDNQTIEEENESTNLWNHTLNLNTSILDNTSLDVFDKENSIQENATNLTLNKSIVPSDVVEIVYSDLEQGEVILNKPVNWSEKALVINPLNESIEGNITLDIPEDAFNLRVYVENISYNTSKIWMKLEPRENKTIEIHFQTDPVRMDIEYVNLNVSSLLPPDAKNITVFQNGSLVKKYEDTKHVSMELGGIEKRFVVYHNSSLHYHNITIEMAIKDKNVKITGMGNFTVKDKKLRWHIDELSDANLTMEQNTEIEQGDAFIGRPVKWTLRTMNYLITYETPPPSKVERIERYNDHIYKKDIDVSSNSSLSYRNVKVWTRIPEIRYGIQVSFDDSDHKKISYDLLDKDGNNLFDTIEWTIPELSQRRYVVSVDFDRVRFADRFADHINNYNGTYTAHIYGGFMNYYDKERKCFLPINTTIEKNFHNGFEYANLKNNFASYFDEDEVRVMLKYNNCSITYSLVDQEFGNIENFSVFVNGSTITYENVFDGIDLRYRVTYDGLSEEIVLKKPLDIKSLTERIELSGDCYYEESNGIIYLCSKGSRIFEIKRPFMREENDPVERCYDLHYEIKKRGDLYYITKVIDN
ncbi:MAG: hypothetical protein DRN33_04235, partial [Thermoplasmata archaeon]